MTHINTEVPVDNRANIQLENKLTALQKQKQLGVITTPHHEHNVTQQDGFAPCMISLTPWQLSERHFELAIETAQSLSHLLACLINSPDLLLSLLADFQDTGSLVFKLTQQLTSRTTKSIYLAENLNISRYDFLLNQDQQWQLVEANAIAAGMGPFSEKLAELLTEQLTDEAPSFAANPSISKQAGIMFEAASKKGNTLCPVIIFVVQVDEDNVFDQGYLIEELQRLGARVYKKTFAQLSAQLSSSGSQLYVNGNTKIDLVYYRTGYNLSDYSHEHSQQTIQLRDWIEQHQVVVAPSIAHQLSSSKWVQYKLANLSTDELVRQFGLTHKAAQLVSASLAVKYQLIISKWHATTLLKTGNWILKNQNEGGGNVVDHVTVLPSSEQLTTGYFLMEKINSHIRTGVCRFSQSNSECLSAVISELGIFVVGDHHQYGGYLLRSKPSAQIEAGVHGGHGFLDTVSLKPSDKIKTVYCC